MWITKSIAIAVLIGWSASVVLADSREEEVESYLAGFDVASLGRAPEPLLAVDPASAKPAERWHGFLALWIWAPLYADGSSSVPDSAGGGGTTLSSLRGGEPNLIEIDGLSSGFLVPIRSNWWCGRWGIQFDLLYADLELDGTLLQRLGIPFELDLQFWFVDLAATYRALNPEVGQQPWLIQIFFGARFVDFEQALTVSSQPTSKTSESHLEPLLGADFGYDFSGQWSLLLRLDVGGFDVSGDSDFTFNLQLGAIWLFGKNNHGALNFGWRMVNIDYSSGSGSDHQSLDLLLHGPFFGIGWTF